VTSLLADAFGHHTWATLRVLDVCAELSPEQLETTVPGTYGSILDTLRHTVGSDAFYLRAQTDGRRPPIDEDSMDIAGLRHEMEVDGEAWATLVAGPLDPDEVVVQRRADGSETHAPRGIRLAQALHHGTDHRSQICTALTALGIEPPAIDVWDFAETQGRLLEVPATS
jgi:uncharacterized damage-inducible protein DinB